MTVKPVQSSWFNPYSRKPNLSQAPNEERPEAQLLTYLESDLLL
jgi:hypothetical protein